MAASAKLLEKGDAKIAAPGLDKTICFKVVATEGLTLRERPGYSTARTGHALADGEVFDINRIVTVTDQSGKTIDWKQRPTDVPCFLHLADGRGWVADTHPRTDEPLVERYDPDASGIQWFREQLRPFFRSKTYDILIGAVILLNAVSIGIEIDHPRAFGSIVFIFINLSFLSIYVIEITLKMFAFGCVFFSSRWNIFDLAVTTVAMVTDGISFYQYLSNPGRHDSGSHDNLLMTLRLLRLTRVARLVHELRVMLQSFLGSLQALTWIAIGTIIWFYMNACVTTVLLGQETGIDLRGIADAKMIRQRFKNIPESMFTLFELMTLEGWPQIVRPLFPMKPYMVAYFLMFIFVSAFFLLNLVTAIVVDRTLVAQNESQHSEEVFKEDRREILVEHLHAELLKKNGGKDEIAHKDLEKLLKEPEICHYLDQLEWGSSFLNTIIELLEHDENAVGDRVSLEKMSEAWQHFGKTLDAEHLLAFQVQMAQRLHHQERLITKLLRVVERSTGHCEIV